MANRPKLTADLRQRIVDRVRSGVEPMVAAVAEGVSKDLWWSWQKTVGNPAGAHAKRRPKLRDDLLAMWAEFDQALALFECDLVEALKDPPDDWYDDRGRLDKGHINRMTWLLERTRRDRYGVRVTIDDLRPRAVEELLERLRAGLDPETYQRCLDVLDSASGPESEGSAAAVDSPTRH